MIGIPPIPPTFNLPGRLENQRKRIPRLFPTPFKISVPSRRGQPRLPALAFSRHFLKGVEHVARVAAFRAHEVPRLVFNGLVVETLEVDLAAAAVEKDGVFEEMVAPVVETRGLLGLAGVAYAVGDQRPLPLVIAYQLSLDEEAVLLLVRVEEKGVQLLLLLHLLVLFQNQVAQSLRAQNLLHLLCFFDQIDHFVRRVLVEFLEKDFQVLCL